MQHGIIFIHLGPAIPPYAREALAQARLFNGCPIYLLAEQNALTAFDPDAGITQVPCESIDLSEKHRHFRAISKLDKTYRDGFWTHTTERFFWLEALAAQRELTHLFHLENDNLLYLDLETALPVFNENFPNLAGTFDNDIRCVPGFIYARHAAALGHLTTFINEALAGGGDGAQGMNDMALLGQFGHRAGPQYLGPLPLVSPDYPRPLRSLAGHIAADPRRYWNLAENMGGIFDAAAIGQYLGGVDSRVVGTGNTVGFINESCVFDPSAYKYFWQIDHQNRRVPHLQLPGGKPWRIHTIHVHSKHFHPFR